MLGLILGGASKTATARSCSSAPDCRAANRAIIAAANPINFAPHIRAPKLMVQGRYDEDTPLRTAAEPLFKLLLGAEADGALRWRARPISRGHERHQRLAG